jgi:hypothetical protein
MIPSKWEIPTEMGNPTYSIWSTGTSALLYWNTARDHEPNQ